jgi:hypothetical protein
VAAQAAVMIRVALLAVLEEVLEQETMVVREFLDKATLAAMLMELEIQVAVAVLVHPVYQLRLLQVVMGEQD